MQFRAVVLLAMLAPALAAQQRAGAARPPAGDRNPMAEPVVPNVGAISHIRTAPVTNPVLQRIWSEGMERSQAMALAQELMDPIGQRLTASPQMDAAQDWILGKYAAWGVTARKERYGTWLGWNRGVTHVDLIAPRVRSLEAYALAYSPGMARPAEGEVIAYPEGVSTPEQFDAWLPNVKGKYFLMNPPRLSCRSPGQWAEFGTTEETERVNEEQTRMQRDWAQTNVAMSGGRNVWQKLKDAGALGVFTFQFSNYPGIQKVFGSPLQTVPSFAVGCEDYGLLYRMSRANQKPRVRAYTDSRVMGERPTFNVIAEIKGSEKPNEYVVLSAHFDSHSASSGATDNGTGTITMLEALRILKTVYPNPKRTIIVGHWAGEEQGLNGSKAFTEDHPEVISGLQALFNQDNGTGRIVNLSAGPFPGAAVRLESYLHEIPNELTRWIRFSPTGPQSTGGTDHASFVCHKTPAFNLGALSWDYSFTTWHTDRDTYDKVVESDLKNNATLTAMLAYLASEDPQRMPREVGPLPPTPNGQPGQWRDCTPARRSSEGAVR
ncbi:MAG: M20/M25/M40 family metallo-hydrolase [Gemmatimonadaceae bacterium]|nr:M20/M25/M40 family metallo-hydrolase [Gemmatimonadaceae bacterium]